MDRIEVAVRKVNLTKSVVNQMMRAGVDDVLHGRCLCMLANVRRDALRTVIVEREGELRHLPMDYVFSDQTLMIYRRSAGRSTRLHAFNERETYDEFKFAYNRLTRSAEQAYV